MKLKHIKDWSGREKIVSGNASEKEITVLFNSINWKEFNSITLEIDQLNWLNVSGNLGEDGLAIIFEEEGVQFVSKDAPNSVSQLKEVLILYLNGDNSFKKIGFDSEKKAIPIETKKEDYEKWKIKYEAKRKLDRRNYFMRFVFAILIVGIISYFSYLFFTNELKFFGRDTVFVKGIVTKVEWEAVSGGRYFQHNLYEFEYNNKLYTGHFRGTKFTGKHEVGDLIKIKIVTSNPNLSKWVARYKKKVPAYWK